MLNLKLTFLFLALTHFSKGQWTQNVQLLKPGSDWENVDIQKIADDSLCTSFSIWIRSGVKHHFHETHTECIYVLEGSGMMELGDQRFKVTSGGFVQIPMGTIHAVEAIEPMHVLSIQTPQWKTDDRKFVSTMRRPHNE